MWQRRTYTHLTREQLTSLHRFASICGGLAGVPQRTYDGWQLIVCWEDAPEAQLARIAQTA
jgi:hypothetical protein